MAAPRDKLLAEQKKKFAAAHNISERQARNHFNSNSELWQRYKEGSPLSTIPESALSVPEPASPTDVLPPQSEPMVDDESLPPPVRMERLQWDVYDHARKEFRAAIPGNTIDAIQLGKITVIAQDAYYKAHAKLEEWRIQQGQMVPEAKFTALANEFLTPLANIMSAAIPELAALMNPTDAAYALRAGREYEASRLKPQIEKAIAAFANA
jgi:hypothetical protein